MISFTNAYSTVHSVNHKLLCTVCLLYPSKVFTDLPCKEYGGIRDRGADQFKVVTIVGLEVPCSLRFHKVDVSICGRWCLSTRGSLVILIVHDAVYDVLLGRKGCLTTCRPVNVQWGMQKRFLEQIYEEQRKMKRL